MVVVVVDVDVDPGGGWGGGSAFSWSVVDGARGAGGCCCEVEGEGFLEGRVKSCTY